MRARMQLLTSSIRALVDEPRVARRMPVPRVRKAELAQPGLVVLAAQLAVDVQDQVQMRWLSQWPTRMPTQASLRLVFPYSKAVCLVCLAVVVVARISDKVVIVLVHRHPEYKPPLMKMAVLSQRETSKVR